MTEHSTKVKEQVTALRVKTGATRIDCQKALSESRYDEVRAVEWLRNKMLMKG